MAVHEDVKRGEPGPEGQKGPSDDETSEALVHDESPEPAKAAEEHTSDALAHDEPRESEPVGATSPTQLGTRRFVYAAYFAGAIGIAFIASKAIDLAWLKVQSYKPAIGEPRDEITMPVAAVIGAGAAVYYWYRTRARELAEEVASEMAKVTWPTRTEVTNGTVVVILTTIVSTVFFALMDKFWGFVTNLVYGGS